MFLTATEDICVDGLAVTLFTATNPQWASTSQGVGQTLGRFLGSSFLLTLESANFTNQFIREPLSLSPQASGLFTLEQFLRFVACIFVTVAICVIVFVREREETVTDNGKQTNDPAVIETYLSILRLLRKTCVQQLALVLLLGPIAFVAITYMTPVELISQGVSRENLALISIPITLITIVAPLTIRHTTQPLIWLARSHVSFIITAIPLALYVYWTPHLVSSGYYYPVLILLCGSSEFIRILQTTAYIGFYASVSDPRIGGTYMTFLVTISNLGYALNSSIILYAANWFPKKYDFIIAVGLCTVLGILWICLSYRTLKRLQRLPASKWHLRQRATLNHGAASEEQSQDEHELSCIPNNDIDCIERVNGDTKN
ncbi:hypothetical protein I4U23_016513 [Adineta vaga]|nr:hypothetical protein I4U23_016513 [Adineta vaga]